MKRPGYTRQLNTTEDGSKTFYVPALEESYHSGKGAVVESQYVFIEAGLHRLLHTFPRLNVLEVGMGTGLNALLTALEAEAWQQTIAYTALEPYPVPVAEARQLAYPHHLSRPDAAGIFEQIHQAVPWEVAQPSPHFQLTRQETTLQAADLTGSWHLLYFDAFAPSRQPAMWERHLLRKITEHMSPGGIFVTYSAKGQVRRDLQDCGLNVERIPGPPGKREMLRGSK